MASPCDQHRAHRHFAGGFGAARRLEGEAHEIDVAAKCHAARKLLRMGGTLPDCAVRIGDFGRQCRRATLATVRGMATRIGISGWRYEPWRKIFYPEDLAQHRELEFASRAFPSIEINGSFYSLQSPASWAAWYAATPADFVFSVKGPRYITHILRLKEIVKPHGELLRLGRVQPAREIRSDPVAVSATFCATTPAGSRNSSTLLPRDTDAGTEAGAAPRCAHARPLDTCASTRTDRCATRSRSGTRVSSNAGVRRATAPPRHWRWWWPIPPANGRTSRTSPPISCTCACTATRSSTPAVTPRLRSTGGRDRIRAWSRGREPRDARRTGDKARAANIGRDVFCYFDNDIKVRAPFDADRLMQKLGLERADTTFRFPHRRALKNIRRCAAAAVSLAPYPRSGASGRQREADHAGDDERRAGDAPRAG